MRITEIATEPYPYEINMNSGTFYDNEGNNYYVSFDSFGDGLWSVGFSMGITPNDELTNRHDSFRVFATVITIIKNWASSVKPKILMFSASKANPSRVSLYGKLANRFTNDTSYVILHNTDAVKGFELKYIFRDIYLRNPTNFSLYAVIRKDVVNPEKNYKVSDTRYKIGSGAATEVITELAVNLLHDSPNKKVWVVDREPGIPSSEIYIYREGSKVRVDAKVGGKYNKPEDAEHARDVIPLMRAWQRTVISELPKFIRPDDTSIRIEAHGKRAGIYSKIMPAILRALQEVNPGWVYNGPRKHQDMDATLFPFTNYNYNRSKDNWIDKRDQT